MNQVQESVECVWIQVYSSSGSIESSTKCNEYTTFTIWIYELIESLELQHNKWT